MSEDEDAPEGGDGANGDAGDAESEDETEAETTALDPDTLDSRLNEATEALDEAETEADLDAVEGMLDEIEADLEAADLPEPEEEDEDEEEEDPRERLESRLEELRDELEEKRGPYAEEVVEEIEGAIETIESTEWTEAGEADLVATVESFLAEVNGILDTDLSLAGEDLDDLTTALSDAIDAVEERDLHPDEDEETIAALLEAADDLTEGVGAAEEWDDLTVRQKLDAHGFYDVLGHHKDFPPEWSAVKVHEKQGNVEMVLLAHDMMDSDFMEEYCTDALKRMGDERALDAMTQRAQKRDKPAIEVLGKIGSDEPLDMLTEYAAADSDPALQRMTLRALGEIGSTEATQAVATRLASDDEGIRSLAAHSLGLIGDTRAIEPLADLLENDESNNVRGSAAWALNQVGTRRALDAVREYADDRDYRVQSEAEKAERHVGTEPA